MSELIGFAAVLALVGGLLFVGWLVSFVVESVDE